MRSVTGLDLWAISLVGLPMDEPMLVGVFELLWTEAGGGDASLARRHNFLGRAGSLDEPTMRSRDAVPADSGTGTECQRSPPDGTRSKPKTRARRYPLRILKRTQEIQDILLLALQEFAKEFSYDSICFGPRAPVLLYGAFQISGSSVVKKEEALAEPP